MSNLFDSIVEKSRKHRAEGDSLNELLEKLIILDKNHVDEMMRLIEKHSTERKDAEKETKTR